MAEAARSVAAWPEPEQARTHLGTIEYRDVGEGPAIVFLHLVLAEASHWDRMPPLLADRYRCIFPTLPMGAHRLPADADADLTPAGLARAVAELIEQLDLKDVTLVGNDSGGAISQVVAMNHPERLGRVVLTNCDMYDDFPPKIFGYFNLLPHIPGAMSVVGPMLKIRAFWPLPFVFGLLANEIDPVKIDRWADALIANADVRRDARKVLLGFGPDVTNTAAKALRTTELPFLVAWGADDRAFKPALAERFCAEVPTAELVMIPDCKTLVCWDQPQRLAELISGFIETGSGPKEPS
ncbi:MAG: alpha/beta hydrolase [Myxococcota bacterium]|nr:alpha/beta hydrolase [Myxococcota bacterium]